MEPDDDVPLILTWDEANSGLLSEETERRDESKVIPSALGFFIMYVCITHEVKKKTSYSC